MLTNSAGIYLARHSSKSDDGFEVRGRWTTASPRSAPAQRDHAPYFYFVIVRDLHKKVSNSSRQVILSQ